MLGRFVTTVPGIRTSPGNLGLTKESQRHFLCSTGSAETLASGTCEVRG
jgi:hypothetical protein